MGIKGYRYDLHPIGGYERSIMDQWWHEFSERDTDCSMRSGVLAGRWGGGVNGTSWVDKWDGLAPQDLPAIVLPPSTLTSPR